MREHAPAVIDLAPHVAAKPLRESVAAEAAGIARTAAGLTRPKLNHARGDRLGREIGK